MLKNILFLAAIFSGMLSIIHAQENNAKKYAGIWKGSFDAGDKVITVIVKLQESNGKLSGMLEAPERGDRVFDLDNISTEGNNIKFEIPALESSYEGIYNQDTKIINGILMIFNRPCPVNLSKDEKTNHELKKNYESFWEGTLTMQNIGYHLLVKIYTKTDGSVGGYLDSPSHKINELALNTVLFTKDVFKFEVTSVGISYSGIIIDKTTIKGTFSQAGQEIELYLRKVEKPIQ